MFSFAATEAAMLCGLLGRNGDNVEKIRALIAVPPKVEAALRAYMREFPEETLWVLSVLEYRQAVSREFERLVGVVPCAETNG